MPELIGSAAAETADLRAAVLSAGAAIADVDRWIAVGVAGGGEVVGVFGPDTVGTYRGFGAEVTVRLGPADPPDSDEAPTPDPGPPDPGVADTELPGSGIPGPRRPDPTVPLAALTVGWLRDRVAPRVPARVLIAAPEPTAGERSDTTDHLIAAMVGGDRVGFVIVGDGARTLTERAPGGLHPDAATVQRRLDDLLTTADLAGLGALDEQECTRVGVGSTAAWRIGASAVAALGEPVVPRELYRGHPFGVGYWVGTWLPEGM